MYVLETQIDFTIVTTVKVHQIYNTSKLNQKKNAYNKSSSQQKVHEQIIKWGGNNWYKSDRFPGTKCRQTAESASPTPLLSAARPNTVFYSNTPKTLKEQRSTLRQHGKEVTPHLWRTENQTGEKQHF